MNDQAWMRLAEGAADAGDVSLPEKVAFVLELATAMGWSGLHKQAVLTGLVDWPIVARHLGISEEVLRAYTLDELSALLILRDAGRYSYSSGNKV